MAIRVQVVLFGALRRMAGRSELDLALAEGARVRDAVAACGLPDRVDIWALVDGRRADRLQELADGARVELFQPVGGG
jgi:molybdopterin converting factor small subunit